MFKRTKSSLNERQMIALDYLARAADDLQNANIARIRYMGLARQYGVTWRDIATALQVTETAARTLFNRNQDVADSGDEEMAESHPANVTR